MRLATLRLEDGRTTAARQDGDAWISLPYTSVSELLGSGSDWHDIAAAHAGAEFGSGHVTLAAVTPRPNKIICVGLNYAGHIKETGRETPQYPTLFAKFDGSLIGPEDHIHMPAVSDKLDWEAELAVVIGSTARNVREEDALRHVAGYTIVNDVSVRDWQMRTGEYLAGKTFEATTPVGPVLVTADDLPAGGKDLEIGCQVDDVVMQKSNTSDLIFDVAHTIAYISQIITLQPGDLIATGTPAGVGAGRDPKVFLRPGQVVRTWVEGIGDLRNTVVQD